jgi:MFS family permease
VNHSSLANHPPREGLLSAGHRSLTIGLVLMMTLVAFEALAVATAMPVVEDDLGDLELYGLVFSAFMLANIVGIAYAGRAADLHPPARAYAIGLVLFGVGLAISGLAPSMLALVAGRVVQGFGAGAVTTVGYVAIARGYDETIRPRMFAVLSTAWVVPGLIGPAVAGAVAEHLHWRWVFLGLLPVLPFVGLLTVNQFRRLGPTTPASNPTSVLVASGLALGATAVLAAPSLSNGWLAAVLMVAGAVLAVPLLRRLLPPGTFSLAPGLPVAIAVMGLLNLAFGGAEAFLPLTLNDVRGQSPTIAGLALTAATMTWTAGSWIQARKATAWSQRSVALAGLLFVLVGIAGVGAATSDRVPVGVVALIWGSAGLGMGLAYPTISLAVLGAAAEDAVGAASASMQFVTVLGLAIGTGLGGAVVGAGESAGWDTSAGVAVVFGVMAGFCAFAIVAAARLHSSAVARSRNEAVAVGV